MIALISTIFFARETRLNIRTINIIGFTVQNKQIKKGAVDQW